MTRRRRIKNHEIWKEVQQNSIFSKSIGDTRIKITPCETRQNVLLMALILISHTILSNGDITRGVFRNRARGRPTPVFRPIERRSRTFF